MAYPPSRPERDPRPGAPTRDETPLYEAATLYAQSPHVHADPVSYTHLTLPTKA